MGSKIKLFNESDHEEDAGPVEFRTNKTYAKHYDEFRKKEIISHLKNLDVDEESDSSDDETTDDEIVDPDFDKEFFRTLAFLKRKDPQKYTEQPTFFENVKPVEEVALVKRHHKEKPITLKDYERKMILENGGVFEDEDEQPQRAASPSLVEQEKRIKDEIKQALDKIEDSDSDGGEHSGSVRGGGLLKERTKSKVEHEKEQADYIQWLVDKKDKEPPSEEVKDLEPLKHFWNSDKLSREDAFLKDYILNKRFVQTGEEVPSYDDLVSASEDEAELEKQEEYERKYNFRFEEPDSEFIKRYPRTMDDTVRIERNKRKEQREALKERKQKEKEQQRRELEELKAVKLQEIKDRIQRLKEIAATDGLTMDEKDLESEFDPDEHDRRMQRMFNDEYYGVDEGDQKPEFPELDEELGIENYDRDNFNDDDNETAGPHCEDDDFIMDCDYEEQQKADAKPSGKDALQQELLESTRSRKKKGRRESKFREALKAKKPLFDPEDERTYGEYIDEYYKLDYEDMIGDTPCRFRYVETVPHGFGLSIEEILAANTRELNRWASLKKTLQLRPKQTELQEIETYRRKANNDTLKRKLLPSLFVETDANEDEDAEIKERKESLQDSSTKPTKPEDKANDTGSEGAPESKAEKKKKKFKAKKPFTETDATTVEEPVKEKKKKKKQHQPLQDVTPANDGASTAAASVPSARKVSVQKSKHSADEEPHTAASGKKPTPTGDSNAAGPDRKRSWNQMTGKPTGQKKHSHGGPTGAGRFGSNRHGNNGGKHGGGGKSNGRNGHQEGMAKGSSKAESASDQRLRAFGLNPRKFHNKQKYGNLQIGAGGQHKPLNKKIKFE